MEFKASTELGPRERYKKSMTLLQTIMKVVFMQPDLELKQKLCFHFMTIIFISMLIGSAYTMMAYERRDKFKAAIIFFAYVMVIIIGISSYRSLMDFVFVF